MQRQNNILNNVHMLMKRWARYREMRREIGSEEQRWGHKCKHRKDGAKRKEKRRKSNTKEGENFDGNMG